MSESHGFVRIMPDSSGKRIPHAVMLELTYGNGTIPFKRGDVVHGLQSGMVGLVLEVNGTTVSGELHLGIRDDLIVGTMTPVPLNPQFILLEQLQVNGATYAIASDTGYAYYYQQSTIVGGGELINPLEIDEKGAAYVRYEQGSPSFDAFGKMLVAQQITVAEYLHKYGIDTDKVSVNLTGAGAATHIPSSAGVLLSVGTANGDDSEVVSHLYHPYHLGMGRLIEFTTCCGDAGKTNLRRAWGYGDDDDGCFFMQENGIWYARIKSSVSGVVVDSKVPQSEWNVDRVDGSMGLFNKSKINFDITKMNITWLDLQWLGIGTVRFGVIVNGERIICHQWHHGNIAVTPYMRTATLPIYHELKNFGITQSSSEFRLWCTVVKNGGIVEAESKDFSIVPALKTINSTVAIPLCSMRAKAMLGGITNRKSSFLSDIMISSSSPIIIELWKNPILTGATWAGSTYITAAMEYDDGATSIDISASRRLVATLVVASTVEKFDMSHLFTNHDEGIRRHFDPINYDIYTITARLQSGSTPTTVQLIVNWDDV